MLDIFTIYDSKGMFYSQPFYMRNSGEAIRAVTETVNDGQSSLSKYPEDFTLFKLGQWDEVKGQISLSKTPASVIRCIELKRITTDPKQLSLIDSSAGHTA